MAESSASFHIPVRSMAMNSRLPRAERRVYRRKVCVVGSHTAGKSSLVASILTGESHLEHHANGAIHTSFTSFPGDDDGSSESDEMKAMVWDFSGDDRYLPLQASFLTKDTIYLLCVDMEAYALQLAAPVSRWEVEGKMKRYTQHHVLRWAQLIFARQADADVVVVGTKADQVTEQQIADIRNDLALRIQAWVDEYLAQLDQRQQQIVAREKLLDFRGGAIIPLSVSNRSEALSSQQTLRILISTASRQLRYAVPTAYSVVLDAVRQRHEQAEKAAMNPTERIKSAVVTARELIDQITEDTPSLQPETVRSTLLALHDDGGVLWFEGDVALLEYVVVSPTLAFDLFSELMNYGSQEHGDIDDAVIKHEALITLPLWQALNEVDPALVHFFKRLLMVLRLGYPANSTNEMYAMSDIVLRCRRNEAESNQSADKSIAGEGVVRWRYTVPIDLSSLIFNQFVVESQAHADGRVVSQAASQSVQIVQNGDTTSRIRLVHRSSDRGKIVIDVEGDSDESRWQQARYLVNYMELVLEAYPGLIADRDIIHHDGLREVAYSVEQAMLELTDGAMAGVPIGELRQAKPWLPPTMRWYTERAWLHLGRANRMKQQERAAQQAKRVRAIKKMKATPGQPRRVPAVFTVVSDGSSLLQLCLFSDVSGECFHDGIQVNLQLELAEKYEHLLKPGVSVFSTVPSVDVYEGVIQAAPDYTKRVYGTLVNQPQLSSAIDPETSRSFLQDLLMAGDATRPLSGVGLVSNLVCVSLSSSNWVWMSRDEYESVRGSVHDMSVITERELATAALWEAGPATLRLRIESVRGLDSRDWGDAFCTWWLPALGGDAPLLSGQTLKHEHRGLPPSWKTEGSPDDVEIQLPLATIRTQLLEIEVKRSTHGLHKIFRQEKSLGHCTLALSDVVPAAPTTDAITVTVDTPLQREGSASRSQQASLSVAVSINPKTPSPPKPAGEKTKRGFLPAVWLVECHWQDVSKRKKDLSTVSVRLVSDLSGLCYHEPITVSIPHLFRGTEWIQVGVSVFSLVDPSELNPEILHTSVDRSTSGRFARRAAVHDYTGRLDEQRYSSYTHHDPVDPATARRLLFDLLEASGVVPQVSEVAVLELSNLIGAVHTYGSFVCAHATEISSLPQLTAVPTEILQEGEDALRIFHASLLATPSTDSEHTQQQDEKQPGRAQDPVLRRRICLVGPSFGGKTSLVKSVTTLQSQLVDETDRTIGIDLFPLSFNEDALRGGAVHRNQYHVTFWDFAGQDIYQVAHSLFFSKRTLFLLCVDMDAYVAEMATMDTLLKADDLKLQRSIGHKVFRWARLIYARRTDAEVVLVGTKADKLSKSQLNEAMADLRERFDVWASGFVDELAGATQAAVVKSLQEAQDRQVLVSVESLAAVVKARSDVEQIVTDKRERAFPMTPAYAGVLDAVEELRRAAGDAHHSAQRVERLVMSSRVLVDRVHEQLPRLSDREVCSILTTLHDLGDLVWPDHRLQPSETDTVIVDPLILLDVVREVVNHSYEGSGGDEYRALHRDGVMKHSLLVTFSLWGALNERSSSLVLFFKRLLQRFNLAYPAGGAEEMAWDSDLIVPAYWKLQRQLETDDELAETPEYGSQIRWQYTLPGEISETVLDQFAVQSHRSEWQRVVTQHGMKISLHAQFLTTVQLQEASKRAMDLILIYVNAVDAEICWSTVQLLVLAMERVLQNFPGVVGSVDRHVKVDGVARFINVQRLLKQQAQPQVDGKAESVLRVDAESFVRIKDRMIQQQQLKQVP